MAACAQLPQAGVGEGNLDTESLDAECQVAFQKHDDIVLGTLVQEIKLNQSMPDLFTLLLDGSASNSVNLDDQTLLAGENCLEYEKNNARGRRCAIASAQTSFDIELNINGFAVVFSTTTSNVVETITIYDENNYLYSELSGDPTRNNELTGCRYFQDFCSGKCEGQECEYDIYIDSGHTDLTVEQQCFGTGLDEPVFT